VVNASVPVLRVDPSTHYSLQNGVWVVDTATTSPPCWPRVPRQRSTEKARGGPQTRVRTRI